MKLLRAWWWLRDLFARCIYCGLWLPLGKNDRKSWRFQTCSTGRAVWICPFCIRSVA